MPASSSSHESPDAEVTILLSDHESFGLRERLAYHCSLIDPLAETPSPSSLPTATPSTPPITSSSAVRFCGIAALLECNASQLFKKKRKSRKKSLRKHIAEFNKKAQDERKGKGASSHHVWYAPKLPLPVSFNTRIAFAYERTRMVFVLDASPTLTATYGNMGPSQFDSRDDDHIICAIDRLESMARSYFTGLVQPVTGVDDDIWTPSIEVSVIAVYPKVAASKNSNYFSTLVQGFYVSDEQSASLLAERIAEWAMFDVESCIADRLTRSSDCLYSSLDHMLEVSYLALSNFESYEGKPCITIASDCKAVQCDDTIDTIQAQGMQDCPIHVLDLSGSKLNHDEDGWDQLGCSTFNSSGLVAYPLNIPDDSEALCNICKVTKGIFFNPQSLSAAVTSKAGNVDQTSIFHSDSYFSSPKRIVRPNALQWYTIFALSPLSQVHNIQWRQTLTSDSGQILHNNMKPTLVKNYALAGLKLQALLTMRILDGYQPVKYTIDSRVRVEFILPLDICGLIVHNEVSYSKTKETADIKVSLSGESALQSSIMGYAFEKVCRFLEWQKFEDELEARLCTVGWDASPTTDSPLCSVLATELTHHRKRRHFCFLSFEVIDRSDNLSDNNEGSSGLRQLLHEVKLWSSINISETIFVRKIVPSAPTQVSDSIPFCLVEIKRTGIKRIFIIEVCFTDGVDINTRLSIMSDLKESIDACNILAVPNKSISNYLVPQVMSTRRGDDAAKYFCHKLEWRLQWDPDLLSLIKRRRTAVDGFDFLDGDDERHYALFSKMVNDEGTSELYLIQYVVYLETNCDRGEENNNFVVNMFINHLKGQFNIQRFETTSNAKEEFPTHMAIYKILRECDIEFSKYLSTLRSMLQPFESANNYICHQEDIGLILSLTGVVIVTIDRILSLTILSLMCARLKSFIAEEKLLRKDRSLAVDEIKEVKECLSQAKNASTEIPAYMYITKKDSSQTDASLLHGTEANVEQYYTLLCNCLKDQENLSIEHVEDGGFFVTDEHILGWCYIHIQRSFDTGYTYQRDSSGEETIEVFQYGSVLIDIYDPTGSSSARETSSYIAKRIEEQTHRVNSLILLDRLHRTRTSSSLLIPLDEETSTSDEGGGGKDVSIPSGRFQCNVVYKMTYKLYDRFVVSRAKISLSYILDSFAVSNRQEYFVYKDEEEQIFYLKLQEDVDVENSVNLLVFGDQKPGESITKQLHGLLAKRLMTESLEVLEVVLSKNAHFTLETTDIDFLKRFQHEWDVIVKNDVNDEPSTTFTPNEQFYDFPMSVYDPVLVMVYFRQNISGSTFFNVLNVTKEDESSECASEDGSTVAGAGFKFDPQEFSLYFISSRREELDPNFQQACTLTAAGATFAREAGTGIAIVEMNLLDSCNRPVEYIGVGIDCEDELDVNYLSPLGATRFRKVELNEPCHGHFRLSFKITNTTLNVTALHKWIELTLNQALASWFAERHIETVRYRQTDSGESTANESLNRLESVCNGLSKLGQILLSSDPLPHPGMKKIEFKTNVGSMDLRLLTMNLLETALLQTLFNDRKLRIADVVGLQTMRVEDDSCHTIDLSSKIGADTPVESLQYVAVYGLGSTDTDIASSRVRGPKQMPPLSSFLFQKVYVNDQLNAKNDTDCLTSALKKLRDGTSSMLSRRIAFILRVTRCSISALFYNWHPQTFQVAFDRLKEVHSSFELANRQKLTHIQKKCLGMVGMVGGPIAKRQSNADFPSDYKRETFELNQQGKINDNKLTSPISSRSERKSSTILMPTIVGRPKKGSAIQAVAFRRKNASSSRSIAAGGKTRSSVTSHTHTQKAYKAKDTSKLKTYDKQSQPMEKDTKISDLLPPSFQREYQTVNNLSQNALGVSLCQNIFIDMLGAQKEKERQLPFALMSFILDHGILLGSQTFQLVGSSITNPSSFLAFAGRKISNEGTVICKTLRKQQHSEDAQDEMDAIYFMNHIPSLKKIKALVVFELLTIRSKRLGVSCRSRCWLFTDTKFAFSKSKFATKVRCLAQREIDAAALNRVLYSAINQGRSYASRCQSEVLNFASIVLRKRIKQKQLYINIPMILRETIHLFPLASQQSMNGIWHGLLHHPLYIGRNEFPDSALNLLIEHFRDKGSIYNLAEFSKDDDTCFVATLPTMKDVHIFLLMNEDFHEMSKVDLFILSPTYGRSLETLVFDGVSPFAKRLSEHIFSVAKTFVVDLFAKAIVDLQ